MSTTRLNFLYPHLYKSFRLGENSAATTTVSYPCTSNATNAAKTRRLRKGGGPPTCTSGGRHYATFITGSTPPHTSWARRHGKAVESPLTGSGSDEVVKPSLPPATASTNADVAASGSNDFVHASGIASIESGRVTETKLVNDRGESKGLSTSASPSPTPSDGEKSASAEDDSEAYATPFSATAAPNGGKTDGTRADAKRAGPLEVILHRGPPGAGAGRGAGGGHGGDDSGRQHSHMSPSPYVHHFDSYSLVKHLENAGYSEAQAITAMKAIRGLLAQYLDVAQDNLVSKSDVENETYLFQAACSELGSEVHNNRRIADEDLRQQRTLLQHEMDILSQALNQELLMLNDSVKGMFNDRKIAVREEQKAVESTIQQINYKISISLSSDAKSEIEGLRWVLIRRSVIGIVFMVVMTLGMLRYGTYVKQESKREVERKVKEAEMLKASAGKKDHSSSPDAAEILAAN